VKRFLWRFLLRIQVLIAAAIITAITIKAD